MCKEYRGPTKSYERLGMKELWLPTVDHFEPTVQDYKVYFMMSFSYEYNMLFIC